MNKRVLKTILGIALGLSIAAVPGYCNAFLVLSTSSAGGSVQVTGNNSSETLTSLSGVLFNSLQIENSPTAADNGTWTLTGSNLSFNTSTDVFTLVGTFSSCSGCVGTPNLTSDTLTIESFKVSGMPYNTAASNSSSGFNTAIPNQGSLSLFYGTPTSFNETSTGNGTFLSDLGLASASSTLTSGGVISNTPATANSGVYTFTPTSETMNITLSAAVATPEPVSFVLFGSGMLGLAAFARRRKTRD